MDKKVSQLCDHKNDDSSLPNHMQIIPTFYGYSDDTDTASKWINTLKSVALYNRWSNARTLDACRSHLEGTARRWYVNNMRELNTFEKFITSFEQTFMSQESNMEIWKRMYERVEQRGETVFAYFHDKMRLCRRLNLSPAETKKEFCNGLHSREMRAELLSNDHTSERELLSDLRMYTLVHANRSEHFQPEFRHEKQQVRYDKSSSHDHVSTYQMKRKDFWGPSTYRGRRCYNCQQCGHIARDCTLPQITPRCIKCNSDGHTAKHCRARQHASIKTPIKKSIMESVKKVLINNHDKPIIGLIGIGNLYTTIQQSVADRYGLQVRSKAINISVYRNAKNVVTCGETTAMVSIDGVREVISLLVVDDRAQSYEIIIGQNFPQRDKVSFIKTDKQILFPCEMKFPCLETRTFNETMSERVPEKMEVMLIEQEREPITASMVKYNQKFTEAEVTMLVNLLNEYRMCFAFNIFELECTNTLTIDIVDTNRPTVSGPYRASDEDHDTIDKIVAEWHKSAGIVTETKPAYASPILLVRKENGEPRLMIDYGKLNSQTVRKIFPTPNMEDYQKAPCGSKLFCTLGLALGYLQVPTMEEAKAKTDFITPSETGQFERMVLGVVNASSEFSKLMQGMMQHLQQNVGMWYLDDMLVPAQNFEDMLIQFRKVLDALQAANLTLKIEKCYFGLEEVDYLGLKISADGIKPGQDKVSAIRDMPQPIDQHGVRSYLELTEFFRRFVPQYDEIAKPLTELLKDSAPFQWEAEQQQAFAILKNYITGSSALQLFNHSAYTESHCDASRSGF